MTTEVVDRRSIGLRSERGPVLISLMLTTALVALDSTIIATAVLTIVDDLGGFTSFPWLFSVYLLAQAVSTPIYGKLADLFGRKPVMLWGIGVFCVGSVLCASAWSMPALIAFRAVQGLGAGAVQPMGLTIAGDIYTLAERAKAQAYLASVWGMSAVVGPTLGGLFSEYLSWRWIFWVNVPLCALAAVMLIRNFVEPPRTRNRPRIDYLGATFLSVGAALLILGLLEGGQAWAWGSPVGFGVFAVAAVALGLFVLVESRAKDPVLPLWVLTSRVLVASSLVAVSIGAIVMGLASYVPTFAQGVLGTGALVGGFALAALTVGWPVSAALAGRLYLRLGFRSTALVGGALTLIGTAATTQLGTGSQVWHVAAACFVTGAGLGLAATPTLIASQTSVDWEERGVVTATNMFARSLGSAVGVAIFGALANGRLGGAQDPSAAELSSALDPVFLAVTVAAAAVLVAAAFMPGRTTADGR